MHVDYVFLNVCFFLWFDAIAVFEAGKSLTDKVSRGKECLHGLYILWRFDGCWWICESDSILSGSHTGESVLALQVEMWNKRKSVWRRTIYRKYVSWGRLQKRGTKFKRGQSFKHWPRGSPGQWFPETECLRASAIFVSGTSGITPILNYRSVNPIKRNTNGYKQFLPSPREIPHIKPNLCHTLALWRPNKYLIMCPAKFLLFCADLAWVRTHRNSV